MVSTDFISLSQARSFIKSVFDKTRRLSIIDCDRPGGYPYVEMWDYINRSDNLYHIPVYGIRLPWLILESIVKGINGTTLCMQEITDFEDRLANAYSTSFPCNILYPHREYTPNYIGAVDPNETDIFINLSVRYEDFIKIYDHHNKFNEPLYNEVTFDI